MHRSITVYKWKLSKTVLNKYVGMVVMWETGGDGFFTGGSVIMDYGLFGILGRSEGLNASIVNLFLTNMQLFTSQDVDWMLSGLLVDYSDVFISCLDSHSDGTHSLQGIHWLSFWRHPFTAEHPLTLILTAPIHCRASIGKTLMQWHISPNLLKKQTHLHLGW